MSLRRASGLRAWVVQRVSAVYLLLFTPLLVGKFLFYPPPDHTAWVQWVSNRWVAIGLLLFFVALLMHAWVGVRDILIDYVHPLGARVVLLTLLAFGLLGCGFWALDIVLHAGAH